MERYKVLDITFLNAGAEEHIYPVLLLDEEETVLVDCGYPGSMELVEAEMYKAGVSPHSLTKILLTHHDDDHMGAAAEFVRKYPEIKIAASLKERPYISGRGISLRLEQAERMQEFLPEEQKEYGLQFCERLKRVNPVKVDLEVGDHDCFSWGGGCEIIHTPGHTPGHIAVWLKGADVLITGDAAALEENQLTVANPQFCLDLESAEKSLELIKRMGCRKYICYHGGVFER